MVKPIKLSDAEQVNEHIKKLAPTLAETVGALRNVILSTHREIGERIKWNNPSFYFTLQKVIKGWLKLVDK
jgi:uncharacterized protein YdhG (YjbR/CyaY superfamily)